MPREKPRLPGFVLRRTASIALAVVGGSPASKCIPGEQLFSVPHTVQISCLSYRSGINIEAESWRFPARYRLSGDRQVGPPYLL